MFLIEEPSSKILVLANHGILHQVLSSPISSVRAMIVPEAEVSTNAIVMWAQDFGIIHPGP